MTTPTTLSKQYTYIVEHLDPELEAWSALEYKSIARESHASSARFLLSSVPEGFKLPPQLENVEGLSVTSGSVEDLYQGRKEEVCLLDPKAERELSPEDGRVFGCFLFGGILGDDPPRDRTSELRAKGFAGRRLGPVQMTTDTAVRVTRMVVQEGYSLDTVPYIDNPEIKVDEHESTQMPFRYVKGKDGEVVMPEGMIDLIKKDTEKGLDDLL